MPKKKPATRARRSVNGPTERSTEKKTNANGRRGQHEVESLRDGFLAELADMMNAETQLLSMLQKMAGKATSRRLCGTFETHAEQTREHIHRLERVFRLLGEAPWSEKCEGIQGILDEGKELLEKTGEGAVRDAMLIAAAQKAEHYEMASYGTLCAWADEMGEIDALRLLDETLWEEKMADRNLSWIAESMSNEQARMREGRAGNGSHRREGWVEDREPRRDAPSNMGEREPASWRDRPSQGGRSHPEPRHAEMGRERSGRFKQREDED